LTAAAVVTVVNPATAASKGKKLTLDQAWALCKAQVDQPIPRETIRRDMRGAARAY
jgi:hypothetical protein